MKHTVKKLLSLLLVIALVFGISVTAMAKTTSEPIDPPTDEKAIIFDISIGNVSYDVWLSLFNSEDFEHQTYTYGTTDEDGNATDEDGNTILTERTGVMLTDLIDDIMYGLAYELEDDYKVAFTGVDGYVVTATVGEVMDEANRYMIVLDPTANADGETEYDDSYIRICRLVAGDESTLSNKANIRCVVSIEIFDENGDAITLFDDLGDFGWATSAIEYLAGLDIVHGVAPRQYNPGAFITRGDFMLMLDNAFDFEYFVEDEELGDNFPDVPEGKYYYDAILAAKALGIAAGSDGSFFPENNITRQEAFALLARTLVLLEIDLDEVDDLESFSDKDDVDDWAREDIAKLVAAGIVNGADGMLNPKNSINRAETAAIVARVIDTFSV